MTINEMARQFSNSLRGRYIIGQALHIAIGELKKVPLPHREESNIADMEFLMNELFPIYSAALQAKLTFGKGMIG
jgi:hypothetical protein